MKFGFFLSHRSPPLYEQCSLSTSIAPLFYSSLVDFLPFFLSPVQFSYRPSMESSLFVSKNFHINAPNISMLLFEIHFSILHAHQTWKSAAHNTSTEAERELHTVPQRWKTPAWSRLVRMRSIIFHQWHWQIEYHAEEVEPRARSQTFTDTTDVPGCVCVFRCFCSFSSPSIPS